MSKAILCSQTKAKFSSLNSNGSRSSLYDKENSIVEEDEGRKQDQNTIGIYNKQRFGSGSTAFGRIWIHFNPRSGSGSTSISFLGIGSGST